MPNSLKYLIDFVKSELDKRNWSERELARHSGLTAASINFVLRGDKDIRHSTTEAIGSALGTPAFYLLMSPEERIRWDSLKLSEDPKAHLRALIDQLPTKYLENAESALDSLIQSFRRQSDEKKKKA